eukprot:m.443790 g.443790  ORF g.443790 m.443790 type:complete len:543 (-) comp19013_c0_seq1:264-1892(-)
MADGADGDAAKAKTTPPEVEQAAKGSGSRPGSKQGSRRGSGASGTAAAAATVSAGAAAKTDAPGGDTTARADSTEPGSAARSRKGLGLSMFRSKRGGKTPLQAEANGEAVVGRIEGCPIDTSVYDAEWETFKAKGWPRRVSRLFDNVDGVLRDQHCLRYFIAYLKSVKLTALLKFWTAAEKFAQGNFDADAPAGSAPKTAPQMAQELYAKFLADQPFPLPDDIRTPLVKLLGGDAPPESVPLTTFRDAQAFVHRRMKNEQFVKFTASPQYAQYCLSILSSPALRVEDMLYNESFRAEFMDYMIRHDCANLMNFWIIANEFQSQASAKDADGKMVNDEKTMMADAKGIFSRYAGPDAMEPIGLDEVVMGEVSKRLKAGKVAGCFVRALHTVYVAVATLYFPEYLQSQAFQQYLKGLNVAANPEAAKSKTGEAMADGDAEDLEAGDEDKRKTMVRTHSLGSIDEWGVYVRDEEATNPLFEEKSSRRAAGVATYVMKRSVGIKPKTKADIQADEEAALQQAKDVINSVYGEMAAHHTIDEILKPS